MKRDVQTGRNRQIDDCGCHDKGKTLIVIAHRLSTIIDSDQIVVIRDGEIAAKGTHTELLKESALYKKMWEAHIYAKDTEEGGVAE